MADDPNIDAAIQNLNARVAQMERELAANAQMTTRNTERIEQFGRNTQDIVDTFQALAGGFRVLRGVGHLAKPLACIIGLLTAIVTAGLDAERWVVSRDQAALARCIEVPVRQSVFDALSSHAHNFGVGNTCASRAVKLINAGDAPAGCDALAHAPDGTPVWSYVSRGSRKEFVPGLYNRRLAERALCLSGLP
ncbi:lysozyme [Pseudomonadota bacterium AL_CKDN230030165-1A_HGKHYDSX7]